MMAWCVLAQKRNQWSVLANTVMNLRVPLNVDTFLSLSKWRILEKRSAPWSLFRRYKKAIPLTGR
jgi:hypothetical protein